MEGERNVCLWVCETWWGCGGRVRFVDLLVWGDKVWVCFWRDECVCVGKRGCVCVCVCVGRNEGVDRETRCYWVLVYVHVGRVCMDVDSEKGVLREMCVYVQRDGCVE